MNIWEGISLSNLFTFAIYLYISYIRILVVYQKITNMLKIFNLEMNNKVKKKIEKIYYIYFTKK